MLSPFDLRRRLKWEGRAYSEPATSEPVVPPTERGQALHERYGLERWSRSLSRATLEECLGLLDLLDRLPSDFFTCDSFLSRRPIRAIDVGAKNWRYLGALSAWLDHLGLEARVDGVELDAYRIYPDLRTRISCARHFCQLFSNETSRFRFHAGDIREWIQPAELITWFFPFVSPRPHRAWGLPKRVFQPRETFAHVERLLVPGGRLVLCNQGDWEWQEAKKLLPNLTLRYQEVVEGSLHASDQPIFLTLWTRDD